MRKTIKPAGYWTKERCKNAISKCRSIRNLAVKFPTVSTKIYRMGWSELLEPIRERYPFGFFDNIKNCHDIALRYKNIFEFRTNSSYVYKRSLEQGFIREITSHMEVKGNLMRRGVYYYKFEDGAVYVGLTSSFERRHTWHLARKDELGQRLKFQFYIYDNSVHFLTETEAQKEECDLYEYFTETGHLLLNKSRPGALGTSWQMKWTIENCMLAALQCNTLNEFRSRFIGAYRAALKHEWSGEVTAHLKRRPETIKWTAENLKKCSLKFRNIKSMQKAHSGAYLAAVRLGILYDLFPYARLGKRRKP